MKRLSISLVSLLISFTAFGGGIGGGPPPLIETPNDLMMSLQSSSGDDYIRVTEHGRQPTYFKPDLSSIKFKSIEAMSLPSGETALFYAPSESQQVQSKIGTDIARTFKMTVTPGLLPILPEELVNKPKPNIEVVKIHEIDAEAAEKIFSNDSGSSTSTSEDSTN